MTTKTLNFKVDITFVVPAEQQVQFLEELNVQPGQSVADRLFLFLQNELVPQHELDAQGASITVNDVQYTES